MPSTVSKINDSNTFVIISPMPKGNPVFLNGMDDSKYTWIYDPRVAWPFTRRDSADSRLRLVVIAGHKDAEVVTRADALRRVDRNDIREEVPNV